jgi:iron complex outermembrane receptor protein
MSGISVRGFREDFVGTTMNGRELIGIGDNRGVEYDLYPPKSSTAPWSTRPQRRSERHGRGRHGDLRTIHPLEHKRTLVANGTLEKNAMKSKNPDFKDSGYRLALSFSDKFADDTIGVALTAATTSSPTQDQYFSVWGYDKGAITSGPDAGKYAPAGIDILALPCAQAEHAGRVIEFKPSDVFHATFDALYIDFSDRGISRGFIEALPIAADGSTVISSNATAITSARTTGFNPVLRTDPLDKRGKLKTFGGISYEPSQDFHVMLDVSHSEHQARYARGKLFRARPRRPDHAGAQQPAYLQLLR